MLASHLYHYDIFMHIWREKKLKRKDVVERLRVKEERSERCCLLVYRVSVRSVGLPGGQSMSF